MSKKCILFDADGVLIHSENYSFEYQRQSGISDDEMLPFYTGVFQDCLIGKADLKEVIKPWLKKWKWNGTIEGFLNNWFEYENKPDAKVIDFIKELRKKGIVCCLATNNERYRMNFIKDRMGFGDFFDRIYPSSEIGVKKPEIEFYEYIFREMNRKYGFTKDELFYVDDTVSHIDGANSAGIDAYHFTGFESFKRKVLSVI